MKRWKKRFFGSEALHYVKRSEASFKRRSNEVVKRRSSQSGHHLGHFLSPTVFTRYISTLYRRYSDFLCEIRRQIPTELLLAGNQEEGGRRRREMLTAAYMSFRFLGFL
ncbi:hypothetical protein Hanom_Chr08g00737001 [Helianthus anomalus]